MRETIKVNNVDVPVSALIAKGWTPPPGREEPTMEIGSECVITFKKADDLYHYYGLHIPGVVTSYSPPGFLNRGGKDHVKYVISKLRKFADDIEEFMKDE